jgi:hypothetical protein
MLESQKATGLIDEWRQHEERIVEIKKELASILGVSPSVVVRMQVPMGQVTAARVQNDQSDENHTSIAPGTKARATIEAMHSLGGKAKAGQVHERLLAQELVSDDAKGMKSIRSYFNFLKKKEYIIAVKGNRGTWALTPKATSALGGAT